MDDGNLCGCALVRSMCAGFRQRNQSACVGLGQRLRSGAHMSNICRSHRGSKISDQRVYTRSASLCVWSTQLLLQHHQRTSTMVHHISAATQPPDHVELCEQLEQQGIFPGSLVFS